MFKFTCVVILAVIATISAKPEPIISHLAYSTPLIAAAPAVVTATSSQVIARNYNQIASAPLVAAAAPFAYRNAAYATSLAYTAPVARYVASPAIAAPAIPAPLKYTAAPALIF